MKSVAHIALVACLAATPVAAQEEDGNSDVRDGARKMSEAFELLFKGLSKEMEPLSDAWREMLEDLGDLPQYEAPETLPNGDIIIRRKRPLPDTIDGTPI